MRCGFVEFSEGDARCGAVMKAKDAAGSLIIYDWKSMVDESEEG